MCKLEVERYFLCLRILYQIHSNVTLTGETLEVFQAKSHVRKRCPLSLLLFHVLKVLASARRPEKEKRYRSFKGKDRIVIRRWNDSLGFSG